MIDRVAWGLLATIVLAFVAFTGYLIGRDSYAMPAVGNVWLCTLEDDVMRCTIPVDTEALERMRDK
jgi:hypothetical protein